MNFNKSQLSLLLKQAQGNRSLNRFAKECGVSNSYVSNLIKCKRDTAPSMEILQKFAEKSQNGITFELLIEASGYVKVPHNSEDNTLLDYWKERAIAAEQTSEELVSELNKLKVKMDNIQLILNGS